MNRAAHPWTKVFPPYLSMLPYFASNLLPNIFGNKFDTKYESIETKRGETFVRERINYYKP